ncbi:MAG: PA2779 family protein [Desulfatirhabdiaceae bacterium]
MILTAIRSIARPICFLLIFSFTLLDFSASSARAGLIGTEAVLNERTGHASRIQISTFLDRQDVQLAMISQGVNPDEAQKRVASLSDAEIARISNILDQLPAGGDGVGAIVGAMVLIFLILLITDILGLTTVFPFVRHRK